MPEPGREQKTGQRSREIVQILPATLLVKRNLDLQHEPRYPDRGLKRFASFRFALEHQMDKPLQQNKSRLWMLVWQVLGLGLLLYGADHLVLITILNLEQVDLSTRFIQGCFGLAAWGLAIVCFKRVRKHKTVAAQKLIAHAPARLCSICVPLVTTAQPVEL